MYPKTLLNTFLKFKHEKKFKIILAILVFFLIKEIIFVITLQGNVSSMADGYSEANSVRGAYYYSENGFREYGGLPDLCYSKLHDGEGFRSKKYTICREGDKKAVYTHYPPGSEYLATPLIYIFGPNMFIVRLQPIFFNFMVSILFITLMFHIFSLEKAFWISLLCLFPPMFHNYWHGLHHQGYAFSLTLLQLALITLMWTNKQRSLWNYVGLFFLGFLHGWLTFDYAFVATFISLPLFYFLKDQNQLKIMNLFWVVLWSGLGFTCAHIIHFYQVIWYYGNFQDAFNDLFGSAKYRFNNDGALTNKIKSHNDLNPLSVAKDFLWRVAGRGRYTAVNLINYVWIVLALKWIKRIDFKIKNYKFEFNISKNDCYAILAAVFVSSLWSLVMRQHAFIHGFIARHYYFVFLFCTLVMVRGAKRIKD